MKHSYFFLFCLLLASCEARYASVTVDVDQLADSQRFIGEMISERVAERVPDMPGETLSVSMFIDSTISGETARVSVCGGKATISAGRTRALIYGSGALLRAMEFDGNGFTLKDGTYDWTPKASARQCYMARHFNTWYQWASAEEIIRYIDDMLLWGINTLTTQLTMNYVNLHESSPEDIERFDSITRKISDHVSACDILLLTSGGGNKAPRGFPASIKAEPVVPARGFDEWNVCPNKPGGLEYLLNFQRSCMTNYKNLGLKIGAVSYIPYDEGGCGCEKCKPWGGNGYVHLLEKLHEVNQSFYPGAQEFISTWFFDDTDWEAFYKYLEETQTEDGRWIDYIIADSHTKFPRYPLEHKVPHNIPVITFPEISMWGRCPWGGYGATPLPKRFERNFREVENIVDGFKLYSEGLFEDINKVVITGIYCDSSKTSDDILEEYADLELPGAKHRDFAKLIDLLEKTHLTGADTSHSRRDVNFLRFLANSDPELLDLRQKQSEEAYQLALKITDQIIPQFRDCWRWKQIVLRATIDREIFSSRQLHTEVADRCYYELVKLYHGERQLELLRRDRTYGITLPPFDPEVQMP